MSQTVRTILLAVVFAGMGGGVAYQRFFSPAATKAKSKSSAQSAKKSVVPAAQTAETDGSPADEQRENLTPAAPARDHVANDAPPAANVAAVETPPVNSTGSSRRESETAQSKPRQRESPPFTPNDESLRGILFNRLDKNQDGVLEGYELPDQFRAGLLAADGDGNGKLDEREFSAGLERLRSDAASAAPSAEPRSVGPLLTPPPPGQSIPVYIPKTTAKRSVPNWFRERDKNDDGQIGLYEWPSDKAEEFKRLDENGDGFITLAEATRTEKSKSASP